MSQLLILTNGQALPVCSIVEIDVYESYGNGFRAKIWRTEGYENLFTEWSIDDMKNAKDLKIKITMKTDQFSIFLPQEAKFSGLPVMYGR